MIEQSPKRIIGAPASRASHAAARSQQPSASGFKSGQRQEQHGSVQFKIVLGLRRRWRPANGVPYRAGPLHQPSRGKCRAGNATHSSAFALCIWLHHIVTQGVGSAKSGESAACPAAKRFAGHAPQAEGAPYESGDLPAETCDCKRGQGQQAGLRAQQTITARVRFCAAARASAPLVKTSVN